MMNRLLGFIALVAIALSTTACAGTKIGDFVSAATSTINNPVQPVNLYQAKVVYAAAQDLVLQYKDKCFGIDGKKTVAQIQADSSIIEICTHRISRWNLMKKADANAYNAIKVADSFIVNNPSGNAVSYITAAWKAATDFKTLALSQGAK